MVLLTRLYSGEQNVYLISFIKFLEILQLYDNKINY